MPNHKNHQDAAAYLAAIIDSSEDAIISTNLDGLITSWNKTSERLFGYLAEEAVGQHITLIIPTDRHDEEYLCVGKVKKGLRVEHLETVRQAKDGSLLDISLTVSPIKNGEGQIIGASKIARDITALKKAEQASAYLAAIVESSDDAIISKNLEGVVTSWNKGAERIFGYAAEEAIGRHISFLFPPELLDEEFAILGKIKSGQRIEHFKTVRVARDGRKVDVSLTVSPILDVQGRVIGASKIARDISRQKLAEELILDNARRKDEFLANMSHELRSPMNVVVGVADLLRLSDTLPEQEKEYVRILRQSADNLMALINDLLDFSKLESGSLELEEIEFSLPEIIDRAASVARLKTREKDLEIKISFTTVLNSHFMGDPFRIQQILTNLLDNAVKFTKTGMVEISVGGEKAGNNQTLVTIHVTDTGVGIPDDKIPTIFDKFSQADASTTRKYGGSGLGLSICRALTEKMGGKISVRSKVGIGTTFMLAIPLKNGKHGTVIEPDAPAGRGERKDVLVVEDSPPNVVVVTAMLDRFGHNYDVATNGLEAVRKFQQGDYGVVLMDLQMETMDGFESTARIRAYEQEKGLTKTPIVAMTAHVFEKDKQKCTEAGMDGFIPKPFNPDFLKLTISRYISESRET